MLLTAGMRMNQLKQLPKTETPRERFVEYGCEALSNRELLALLIGSGSCGASCLQIADALLLKFGSLQAIYQAQVEELIEVGGVGMALASKIQAALTLGVRVAQEKCYRTHSLHNPHQLGEWLRLRLIHHKREVFGIVLLNARLEAITFKILTKGTLDCTLIHPREIFSVAIQANAHSLVLVHNHPSGTLHPSNADLSITRSLVKAGRLMQVFVNDHFILSKEGYISLREFDQNLFS